MADATLLNIGDQVLVYSDDGQKWGYGTYAVNENEDGHPLANFVSYTLR
jgi:hypothetical protein